MCLSLIPSSIPEQRILKLCEAMGAIIHNRSQAVDLIIDSIIKLRSKIEIPSNLSEMGLKESDIEILSPECFQRYLFLYESKTRLC